MTQAFNLSQLANNVNTSGELNASTGLSSTVPVDHGGTGVASITANAVVLGNGTSAVQTVAPSTSGNVLTSNGTTWISSSPSGAVNVQTFTSSGTWTKPASGNMCSVALIGGGGGGGRTTTNNDYARPGGAGSSPVFAIFKLSDLPSTVSITIGSGGAGGGTSTGGSNGGNTTFGSIIASIGGRGGSSFNGSSFPQPAAPTIGSLTIQTLYGGAGFFRRNNTSGTIGANTGFMQTANGNSSDNADGAQQNYFGVGGATASAAGTGRGSGGAAGISSNGGAGTAGLCRVIVW